MVLNDAYTGIPLASTILDDKQSALQNDAYVQNFASGKGAVQFHNRADAQLFRIFPILREADPKRAGAILESRPELRAAMERFPGGLAALREGGSLSSNATSGGGADPGRMGVAAVSQAKSYEAENALRDGKIDRAIGIAGEIPDLAIRAQVLGSIAASAGEKDPVKGRSTLKSCLDLLDEMKDSKADRFPAWLDVARAAVTAKDDALAWTALDKALADAHASLKEDTDSGAPNEAPRDYWPSTQRYRRTVYLGAKLFGVDAEPLLGRILDPEANLLATIEMARGLLGLSSRTSQTSVSRSKK